ncbi:MAG: hypothetical protein V4501_06935 [Pseudomonadota bacterium]
MQSSSTLKVAAAPSIELTAENIELFYLTIVGLAYYQASAHSGIAKKIQSKYLKYLNSIGAFNAQWSTQKILLCDQITHLVNQKVFNNSMDAGIITGIHKDIANNGELISLIFDIKSEEFLIFLNQLNDGKTAIMQSIVTPAPPLLQSRGPEHTSVIYGQARSEAVLASILDQGEEHYNTGQFVQAISSYTQGETILQAMEGSCPTVIQYYSTKLQLQLSNAYFSYGMIFYFSDPEQAVEHLHLASMCSEHLAHTAENPWFNAQLGLTMLEQHKAYAVLPHNIESAFHHLDNAFNRLKNIILKLPPRLHAAIFQNIIKNVINELELQFNVFGKHSNHEKLLIADEIIRHVALLPNEPANQCFYAYSTKILQEKTLFIFDLLGEEKNKSMSPQVQLNYLEAAITDNEKIKLDNSEEDINYQHLFLKNLISQLTITCRQYDREQIGYFATLIKKIINKIPAASQQVDGNAYASLIKIFINQLMDQPEEITLSTLSYFAVKNLYNNYLMILKIYPDIPETYLLPIEKNNLTGFHQHALLFGLKMLLLRPNPTSKKNISSIKKIMTNHDLYIISPDSISFHFLQQNIAGLLQQYAPLISDYNHRKYFINFAISAIEKIPPSLRLEEDKLTLLTLSKLIQMTEAEKLIYNSAPVTDSTEQTNRMNHISSMIEEIENSNVPGFQNWDVWMVEILSDKQVAIIDYQVNYFDNLINQLEKKFTKSLHLFSQEQGELKKLFHTRLKPLITHKSPELFAAAKKAIAKYITKQLEPAEPLLNTILEKIKLLEFLEVDEDEIEAAPIRRYSI